jgi:hypothetical protein
MLGREACTDAQLRKAIADLNLPVEDDLDYGDAETKQIIQRIKGSKPELPNLNRPQPNQEAYRSQNGGTINSAIALRAQETTSSLQALDERLNQFEDRFAEAAVDRIDSVALRIEQKIAQRLQARQEARYQPQIVDVLDAFTVPDFALPPAIMPSALGCLPM